MAIDTDMCTPRRRSAHHETRGRLLCRPHPLPLNLFDPFGFTKKMTPERKEKALVAEINNGASACGKS